MRVRLLAACLTLTGAFASYAMPAHAQSDAWPNRPIRFIVPFPAGGPTDAYVRTIAGPLGDALKQPVVVENRAGAGGSIGMAAVAKAPPDGYTVGLGAGGALMVLPHLMKIGYSVQQDFAYVSSLAQVPAVIAVNARSGISDMARFLERARRAPGKMNYASAGTGTLVHLAGERFKRETGVDIVHVPYAGAAPAITDLLGGQVESIVSDLTPVLPHVQSGAIRILAVTSEKRSPLLPDTPTMVELGYPGVVHATEYGVVMPAGTPAPIIERLQRELARIQATPAVQRAYAQMGTLAVSSTPEQYRKNVLASYDTWGRFIKETGISLN
ncbi:MAG: tripartite tricarboxylate transporter substrate binding protein [Pigmentiphaga sp.]|uniref:Bug family tripartite tricarboxylate transporter substrate binding protein n=1 Tax=Pigmentiphaga sp. TaxID=1977564 RepID=UPI0029B03BC7|nr:tripartite tricarboxylate transporter substrate binding protein [Pigmentiphaga sp.]MDX3907016.1 tripartite tricarboxylate transporter substrate binding protein [Pigmentiphaga sp.]